MSSSRSCASPRSWVTGCGNLVALAAHAARLHAHGERMRVLSADLHALPQRHHHSAGLGIAVGPDLTSWSANNTQPSPKTPRCTPPSLHCSVSAYHVQSILRELAGLNRAALVRCGSWWQ